MGNIGALSRTSPNDLKITFEHDGEVVSVYLPVAGRSAAELKSMSGDYIACALCCSQKSGFAACMARCLYDGQCCDGGLSNCSQT
jgi:hypothetical protein